MNFQISNVLINAQDEDLLVTEFSIIGQTSSSGTSTISDSSSSMSTNGIESRISTENASMGSTENGTILILIFSFFDLKNNSFIQIK